MSLDRKRMVTLPEGTLFTCSLGLGGIPLVMIHGGPDWDHSYLIPAARQLAQQRQVILFDIRGCGRSTRFGSLDRYNVKAVAQDMFAILEAYQLPQVDVLGFSFGGQVAIQFLDNYPQQIRRLVLASTCLYPDYQDILDTWPEYRHRHTPALQALRTHAFHHAKAEGEEPSRTLAFKSLPLDIYDLSQQKAIEAFITNISFSSEWIRARRGGVPLGTHPDPVGCLNQHPHPILVLHGEKDMRFPVNVATRLALSVETATLYVCKATGHLAHLENTADWVAAVVTFLDND